ncbi:MAG TPA: CPBP family intramembrane glutamic endopeptidase, partial [Chloroflexota bacterium]|nr:CPBP family intramembrane glutamic endopeptidase [Chloroflexota bacterium]
NGQSTINLAQYLTLVVVAAILAPVTEETLFRGVLYQGMRKSARRYLGVTGAIALAVFVDGLLFGGFHLIGGASEINTLPILAFLGIALAVVFQLGRSLGGSMLVHATVNFISVTALFVAHSAH